MVLILDGAWGYNWRGNVAAPREFRRSGSRNCRDLFLSEYRYLVIYGSLFSLASVRVCGYPLDKLL
jgi:hypothetical protein